MFLRSLRSIYFEVYKHPRVFVTSCRELYEYILLQHVRLHVGTYGCWAAPRAGNSSKYFIVLFLTISLAFQLNPWGELALCDILDIPWVQGSSFLPPPPVAAFILLRIGLSVPTARISASDFVNSCLLLFRRWNITHKNILCVLQNRPPDKKQES